MGTRNGRVRTRETLREIGEHVSNAAKRALRNGADTVAADAKSRAPVRTGKLRDSIKVKETSRDGTRYRISADAQNRGYKYGRIVEFSPKINKPFLYPALEANKQQIRENVKEAVRGAIRRGR